MVAKLKKIDKISLLELLAPFQPCPEGVEFLRRYKTKEKAWAECPKGGGGGQDGQGGRGSGRLGGGGQGDQSRPGVRGGGRLGQQNRPGGQGGGLHGG